MTLKLQKNLAKGEAERISEHNDMMKEIYAAIKGIRKEVKEVQKATAAILNNYADDREGAAIEWNKMQAAIDKIKKTGVIEPIKAAEKKAAKVEIVAEPTVEPIIEFQPKVEAKPIIPMTLEEKVLDFINKHPNGLRISEMEQPLGETRMKLGFTAKALLEDEKVQKLENIYFPIK